MQVDYCDSCILTVIRFISDCVKSFLGVLKWYKALDECGSFLYSGSPEYCNI